MLDKYERRGEAEDSAFVTEAVRLHNEGRFDLLAAVTPEALEEAKGFQFFTLQQFYCAAIPAIEADALRMMEVVGMLVEAAGNDLAGFYPNTAYRDWSAAKPDRVDALLVLIESSASGTKDYLSLTLEGGARHDAKRYIEKAVGYLRSRPDFHLGALTALSRIDGSGAPELMVEALGLMEGLLDGGGSDDVLRTHILVAATSIFVKVPALHDRVLNIMKAIVSGGGDGVLNRSANILFNERRHLSDAMIEALLTALEGLNPEHKGTIDILDVALSELLKTGHEARVSAFLESVLQTNSDALTLKAFDSTGNTLLTQKFDLCQDMAVRWLMSGEAVLADGISHLIGQVGGSPVLFTIDLKPYALSDEEALFLARKAVGWFFFHPITAASLLLCIVRAAKGAVATGAGDLLYDPLLLNYSGELRDYLAKLAKGPRDKAKGQVRRALDRLEAYITGLRETGRIAELDPSERERLIEHQRRNEEMRQIQKSAEEASVLMSLVSKSVILHGNGSIGYRRTADGKLHRHIIKMGGISTSWEAPRLQTVDPFGLQALLQSFRAERPQ